MNRTGWIVAAALAVSCLTPALVAASPIPVSNPTIISGPVTGAAVVVTVKPSVWVAGTWWAPSALQGFDGVNFLGGDLPGDYVYRITFDLTGFDPNTAILQGGFATDNAGSIWLNGVNGGNTAAGDYGTLKPFAFVTGFNASINFLDFHVNNESYSGVPWDGPNGENPTGFHYELLSVRGLEATAAAVPEPATLTLLGLGLAGVAGLARARRKS